MVPTFLKLGINMLKYGIFACSMWSLWFSCCGGSGIPALSPLDVWSGCHMLWCYMKQMFSHEGSKSIHLLRNTCVGTLEPVKMGMYALYALLSKKPKSHMKFPQPRKHMLFKHVHLWEYCGMWELFPIESHEIFYVTTWLGVMYD